MLLVILFVAALFLWRGFAYGLLKLAFVGSLLVVSVALQHGDPLHSIDAVMVAVGLALSLRAATRWRELHSA